MDTDRRGVDPSIFLSAFICIHPWLISSDEKPVTSVRSSLRTRVFSALSAPTRTDPGSVGGATEGVSRPQR